MRKIYLITLLFCSIIVFGQHGVVPNKVKELNAKNQKFNSYELFTVNSSQKSEKYQTSATDVTVLQMNDEQLLKLVKEGPELISVTIPYQDELVEVELYKANNFTESFIARDEQGNVLDFELGQYYRGAVKGDYTSLAAISFFKDDVIGVISTHEHGNIILGKSTDKQDYITYTDKNLLGQNPFVCGVEDLDHNLTVQDGIQFEESMYETTMTENCVKIYYEIAYRPYQLNGFSVQNTINWITAIQNNIGTLYANDNINVALHEIKIWTTNDPYTGSHSQMLDQFRTSVTNFSGDLAHLVNSPSTTSVAYLDSICTNFNYAYSGISLSYQQVPTYSWTIMAMTHEMGHSLGSPHTHACAWNGNNTAIDGCGPAAGANEGCSGPIPNNGGTIMSYCHLVSAGINFLNGFGPQPGALIRSKVDSKPCLGTDCSCMSTIESMTITELNATDVQVQITDNTSTSWKYRAYLFGTQAPDVWETAPNSNFTISELETNNYYVIEVANFCGSVEGGTKSTLVLVGDFCDGTLFTDTGGVNGSYAPNQDFVKTFYPSSANSAVKLSFNRVGLLPNRDYMYVYNGDSTDAPLFTDGTITGLNNPGPSFTSTHPTGAITIHFVSDPIGAIYGWEAVVTCDEILGIEDLSASNGLVVYPNPATNVLNVESKSEIQSIQLYDISGKMILNNATKSLKEQIVIEHLPKGTYVLVVQVNGEMITKKIVKK